MLVKGTSLALEQRFRQQPSDDSQSSNMTVKKVWVWETSLPPPLLISIYSLYMISSPSMTAFTMGWFWSPLTAPYKLRNRGTRVKPSIKGWTANITRIPYLHKYWHESQLHPILFKEGIFVIGTKLHQVSPIPWNIGMNASSNNLIIGLIPIGKLQGHSYHWVPLLHANYF